MQSDAVTAFLDDGNVAVLQASLDSSNQLSFKHGDPTYAEGAVASVLYSKQTGAAVSATGFKDAVTTTVVKQSPMAALYDSIHNVFAPMLKEDPRMNSKLRALLDDLDADLTRFQTYYDTNPTPNLLPEPWFWGCGYRFPLKVT